MRTNVLFLCTGNSCRSQMAEAFLRRYGGDSYDVHSAGTNPSRVHPAAIEVMHEVGIDIRNQRSKNVSEFFGEDFSAVITVCDNAKDHCPTLPHSGFYEHWSLRDPAEASGSDEQVRALFREVRNEILDAREAISFEHGASVLEQLTDPASAQGFPSRTVEWTVD